MITISENTSYDKTINEYSLSVKSFFYTNVQNGWIHGKEFLYNNEFIYVTNGIVHIKIDNDTFNLCKNDYMIIPRYSQICGAEPSESACTFYSVFFDASANILSENETMKMTYKGNSIYVNSLLEQIKMHSINRAAVIDALFFSLLFELNNANALSKNTHTSLINEIIEFVNRKIDLPFDLNLICKEFNYNPDYISKVFKKYYGLSLKRYVNNVKMETAKQLLVTSKMTIKQVGIAVGFDDVRLFYKFFKYYEKQTPTVFRKKNINFR